MKNQVIIKKEDNNINKIRTLQAEQESMKNARLRYEREQLECMQKKKMTNEILLKTNMKIHNERKEKEIVILIVNLTD